MVSITLCDALLPEPLGCGRSGRILVVVHLAGTVPQSVRLSGAPVASPALHLAAGALDAAVWRREAFQALREIRS